MFYYHILENNYTCKCAVVSNVDKILGIFLLNNEHDKKS